MSVPKDWWLDFFTGLFAEFWHQMPTPAMTASDVDRALRLLQPEKGAQLLDVPCGDGRHAHELARRGFRVTGVDGSAALLAHARAAGARGVELHQRDMRDLPWPRQFGGACCLGNSFGYLGDDGDRAFLAAVRAALQPGAALVLDAAVLETLLPALVPRRWYEAGGIFFHSEVHYDAVTGVVRSDYTLTAGAQIERRSAWLRVRSLCETLALLRAVGFSEVTAHGPDGAPFAHGAAQALVLARA
jgi:SAM-dependent methyltransferase